MQPTVSILGLDLRIVEGTAFMSPEQLFGLIESDSWKTEDFVLPDGVDSIRATTFQWGIISASTPEEFREEVTDLLVRIKLYHYNSAHREDIPGEIRLTKDDSFPEELPRAEEKIELMKHPLTGDPVYMGYRPTVADGGRLRVGEFKFGFQLVVINLWEEDTRASYVRKHFTAWKSSK